MVLPNIIEQSNDALRNRIFQDLQKDFEARRNVEKHIENLVRFNEMARAQTKIGYPYSELLRARENNLCQDGFVYQNGECFNKKFVSKQVVLEDNTTATVTLDGRLVCIKDQRGNYVKVFPPKEEIKEILTTPYWEGLVGDPELKWYNKLSQFLARWRFAIAGFILVALLLPVMGWTWWIGGQTMMLLWAWIKNWDKWLYSIDYGYEEYKSLTSHTGPR